jgi:hypothetical protein
LADNRYSSRYTLDPTARLDLSNIQEATRYSQNIVSKLDKLQEFAFGRLKGQAEARGKAYGAANKPTLDQIGEAMELGKDPNDLLAQPGTISGDAARGVQVKLLKQDLIADMKNQFATMETQIKNNPNSVNLDDLNTTIDAMINGYSKVITELDVEEGVSFRASASTAGYQVLKIANDAIHERYQKMHEATSEQTIIDSGDRLTTMLNDVDMDINSLSELMMLDKYEAYELFKQEPLTATKNLQAYEDKVKSVISNHIAHKIAEDGNEFDFYNGNPTEHDYLLELQPGMNNPETRQEIFDTATDIAQKKQQLINAKKTIENDRISEQLNDVYIKVLKGEATPDDYKDKAKELGIRIPPERIKEIYNFNAPPSIDDVQKQDALTTAVLAGATSRADLKEMYDSGYINLKIYNETLKQFRNVYEKNATQKSIIKSIFKIPDEATLELLGNTTLRDMAYKAMGEYDRLAAEASLNPESYFNPNRVAEQVANEAKGEYVSKKMKEQVGMFFTMNKRNPIKIDLNKVVDLTDQEIADLTYVNGEKVSERTVLDLIGLRSTLQNLRNEALDPGL